MTENFKKVQGYFKIEAIKDGKVIDTFEHKNLIMDEARYTFAKLLAGIDGTPVINKFVLGTEGHIGAEAVDGGNLLAPKTEVEGFTSNRTQLFSEVNGVESTNFETTEFVVTGTSGDEVLATDGVSTVKTTVTGTDVVYEIMIHNSVCNGDGTIVFTECAFYANTEIFSMRTFKGKIKDDTVSLKITWKIIF